MAIRLPARIAHRYQVLNSLGQGGLGTTFAVEDLASGERVALKILAKISTDGAAALRTEFNLLRGLAHPRLVRVYDFGVTDVDHKKLPYYTAAVVPGVPLSVFATGQPWSNVQRAITDALSALAFLHTLGIRHGDFKPDNVLVDDQGRAVLLDLSCSHPMDQPATTVSGTPAYLAPELLQGGTPDARADIFAVGVTLDELLTRLSHPPPARVTNAAQRCRAQAPNDRPTDVRSVMEELGVPVADAQPSYTLPPTLLGRAEPMDLFEKALRGLMDGRPGIRTMCLFGPDGVGRSRLLQEMKWAAQLQGSVAEGFSRRPRAVSSMLGRAADMLDLRENLSAVFNGRAALLTRGMPVVLFIDDTQSLDSTSLTLLHALVRSLTPSDNVMLVWVADGPPAFTTDALRLLPVRPLGEQDVAKWMGTRIPERLAAHVMRLTGGYPAALHTLLARVSAGDMAERDLVRVKTLGRLPQRLQAIVRALDNEATSSLATLAVLRRELTDTEVESLSVQPDVLIELSRAGLVGRTAQGWGLVRWGDAGPILELLDQDTIRSAHSRVVADCEQRLATSIESEERSGLAAARILHLIGATRLDDATRALINDGALSMTHPAHWGEAAEAIATRTDDPLGMLRAARVLVAVGRPDRALSVLAMLLRRRLDDGWKPQVDVEIGEACLARGEARRALRYLRRATPDEGDVELQARKAALTSRALIQQGDYAAAREVAEHAYRVDVATASRAALDDAVGVAASYLGDNAEAARRLTTAAELHAQASTPAAQFRSASYRGLAAYRSGDSTRAAGAFRDALHVAERHQLFDKLAYAALNLAAASHQNGDWGEALASYERGLHVANALGQTDTEVQVRFNLAKLYIDIGMVERAETVAEPAERHATHAGLTFFSGAFSSLRGEIAMSRGLASQAVDGFHEAIRQFEEDGARRESVETSLQLVESLIDLGEPKAAANAFENAASTARSLGAEDLYAKVEMARGKLAICQGDLGAATSALEASRQLALRVGQRALEVEALHQLAEVWNQRGATALHQRHVAEERELWERIAATLPDAVRAPFWSHPKRSHSQTTPTSSVTTDLLVRKLRRLVQVNAELNSSLRTTEVLNRTMDAAIELVGAERGFVILLDAADQTDGGMTVAVARNLDKESIGKKHLKFSRGIAEQCIASGEPVVTVDASIDGRFSDNASVHAMRLKSVVCVPVRSPAGILGALYLDNRFQRGRFDESDLELLLAFSHHAAIALTNAQLHDELSERTLQLEAERRRVDDLMQGQAQEIDRLVDEVRAKQKVLEHRYDYSNILGRSPGMLAVLSILDRVLDTDAPVLIQGESGTGKELIARAIHFNGRRRNEPFVAINCGAVQAQLLESELFGHVRGAFTGADRDREGLLVSARDGTVLLDEIGEMPLDMQVKLLRVLQDREVRPVGSTKSRQTGFRLVCATNRRLRDEVASGRFREDLFYRIGVVELTVPPLRERAEDIPELAHHILQRVAKEVGRSVPRVERKAMQALLRHVWPGNVRELENVLVTALLMAEEGRALSTRDIQLPSQNTRPATPVASRRDYQRAEEERIRDALVACRWNVSEVARQLGVSRPTLYRRLRRYGIHPS